MNNDKGILSCRLAARLCMSLALLGCALTARAQSDSLIVSTLRKENIVFSHNNSVTLLMSGQQKFDDMFAAIRPARSSIHLEYFK